MGNRIHVLQLHHLVRQQPQRPTGVPFRRLGATERQQVRFKITVCLFHILALRLALPQRRLQPLLYEAALNAIDLPETHRENIGELLPGPLLLLKRPLVTPQQDQRVEHLLATVPATGCDLLKCPPLLLRQRHLVPHSWHDPPPASWLLGEGYIRRNDFSRVT